MEGTDSAHSTFVEAMMVSAYGIPVHDMNDKFVQIAEEAMVAALPPVRFLVDTIPIRKLP